jgi:hypothetical protein
VRPVVVDEGDALQQRGAESQRLAGAGARLPDQVGAGQRERDRKCLDRKWIDDADGFESLGGLGDDSEFGERGQDENLFR